MNKNLVITIVISILLGVGGTLGVQAIVEGAVDMAIAVTK